MTITLTLNGLQIACYSDLMFHLAGFVIFAINFALTPITLNKATPATAHWSMK